MTVSQHEDQVGFTLICHDAGYLVLIEEKESVTKVEVLMKTGLTRREAEVLSWVILGKQNSEIAAILSIKTATVRKHMENIFRKYHCETRGAAARMAIQEIAGSSRTEMF
jgi:DNA-binding CsgD family transcriptional regulator